MQIHNKTIDINWKLVHLISAIERFDACWPAVERLEGGKLKELAVLGSAQLEAGELKIQQLLAQQLDDPQSLSFWYETDLDSPPVVKCAVFCMQHGNQFASALLKMEGYQWARYVDTEKLPAPPLLSDNITDWVIIFLNNLTKELESLMQNLDANGVAQKLSPKQKQLLHIIQTNPGIKTGGIAKKIGVSSSTIKRMLNQFINSKLIDRHGIGPGSYYTLL